jgi:hypothetical protein
VAWGRVLPPVQVTWPDDEPQRHQHKDRADRCRGGGPGGAQGLQRHVRAADRAQGRTQLTGFNERIIALYAPDMTTQDIRAHLGEMYDAEVSPGLISRVTDGVLEELAEWQSRRLTNLGLPGDPSSTP